MVVGDHGYSVEMAIPVAWLDEQQKGPWTRIRVNAAMHDFDKASLRNGKHLWWRPDWRFGRNVEGSGTFEKK